MDQTSYRIMLAAVLYGVTLHQVHRYYTLYPRDFWWYRALVPSLLVLETAHTILNADTYYYYLVTSHGSVTRMLYYRLSLKLSIFVIGASLLLCQVFYASRIYLFGSRHFRHFAFTSVIFPLAVLFALAETALAVEAFSSSSILISVANSWMISATYGSAVAVDTLITGTMIYILLRSRTGFSKTDNTVKALILYSVNTGLVISVVGIIVLITSAAWPKTYAGVSTSFISQRLYCNMVLSVTIIFSLNSRRSLASLMYGTSYEMQTLGVQGGEQSLRCAAARSSQAAEVPVVLALTNDRRTNREVRGVPGDA
ncbi:hypothetical protein VTO73DRAFT_12257 [Trametes versicolor]